MMRLFERDYTKLTTSEKTTWESLQQQEIVHKLGKFNLRRSLFRKYPKAVRHFISLFPNNYLDIVELKDESRLKTEAKEFRALVNSSSAAEQQILNFINKRRAYFIVGALLKSYFCFGHHDAFLFREFPLGTSYVVDYLLVGRSSDGWSFVFVELESPARSTVKNGAPGQSFRKGTSQIGDWEAWLDAHFGSLKEFFSRCKNPEQDLPDEFVVLDRTRLHFVVVAGKRKDFSEKTYRARRKNEKDGKELLLHYDNLVDAADEVIGKETF